MSVVAFSGLATIGTPFLGLSNVNFYSISQTPSDDYTSTKFINPVTKDVVFKKVGCRWLQISCPIV